MCLSRPSLLTIYFSEAEGEAGTNEEFSDSAKAYKLAAETTSFAGVSLKSFYMQTHNCRDAGQVLKMWWSNLSIDKVPHASATHILNCTVL